MTQVAGIIPQAGEKKRGSARFGGKGSRHVKAQQPQPLRQAPLGYARDKQGRPLLDHPPQEERIAAAVTNETAPPSPFDYERSVRTHSEVKARRRDASFMTLEAGLIKPMPPDRRDVPRPR